MIDNFKLNNIKFFVSVCNALIFMYVNLVVVVESKQCRICKGAMAVDFTCKTCIADPYRKDSLVYNCRGTSLGYVP